MKKKIHSFSKLVELVRSNKVYSSGYNIKEYSDVSMVSISNEFDLIGQVVIEVIFRLSRVYSNIGYYLTLHNAHLSLRVYIK